VIDTGKSPPALPSRSPRGRWAFCVLLVLAFGVRLYGLTFHSLWLDEAVSVYLASFPLAEILEQGMSLQEPNPPLYHLALGAWMRVFGSGEAGVRLFSALIGTLYLPAVYLLGKRLFSARVALIATMLAAINPFLVWYSQEARMYALVATLSAWAMYCFVRALQTPRWCWWTCYVVLTVASLYTHLYAVFLLPAQLVFLLLFASRYRKVLWQALLAWGLGLLCFAPWLVRAWQLSATAPSWRPSLSLVDMLRACLEAFTVRRVPLSGIALAAILLVSGVFVLAGLCLPVVPRRASGRLGWAKLDMRPGVLLALTLLSPFLFAYLLSFRQQIFTVYYLIIIVAPFLLALASGLDKIASFSNVAGLISLLVVLGFFTLGLRFDWSLEYRKEEWRAAARYVSEHAHPGDAILCHVDYTRIPFTYYYEDLVPVFAPFGGPLASEADVGPTLGGMREFEAVWLVQSHIEWADPNRSVDTWLAAHFPVVTEQYPPGVEVKGYAAHYRLPGVPSSARPVDAVYDGEVRLAGYELDSESFSATDDTYHPPSGWIHVTLYWQPLAELSEDYVAVVQFIDEAHQVWGGVLERPGTLMRFYPTTAWQVGEVVRDEYDVNLNPNTPAGTYLLQVSLLTSAGELLPASFEGGQGDSVPLGNVRIVSP
jgi:4-amino-4-deoxy-L-arabinose transferase-like glycosyltransferase